MVETGDFFRPDAYRGLCYGEDDETVVGHFIMNYVKLGDVNVPIIIHALSDRYVISSPMYRELLEEWIKAGDTGGYHGMSPLGEIGDEDYFSRSRLHGPVKKSIVKSFPLYTVKSTP